MTKISRISKLLSSGDNFIITTHENPDGDAIGSNLAMLKILRENGKKAEAVIPEPLPENYLDFQEDGLCVSVENALKKIPVPEYIISLDASTARRVAGGKDFNIREAGIPVINIDHHPDNENFGTENLVMPECAASAEIIFRIISGIRNWKLSADSATLLLLGIIMDTGCFRFDNSSPVVLKTAAELLEKGADHHKIINRMFLSKPLNLLKFESDLLLNHLQTECEGRFAWYYLSDEILKKYAVDPAQIEGLIDSLRAVKGVEIAALFRKKDNGFKISLRSKNPKLSVGRVARKLNGGGHEMAAGGFIETEKFEDARKILLKEVKEILEK